MDEEIFFKCRLSWKKDGPYEMRRFSIKKTAISFDSLTQKLMSLLPDLKGKKYDISWIDDEGDYVTISTDDELQIAVTSMPQLVKLYITVLQTDDSAITANSGESNATEHYGVVCDGCDNIVRGFRYKCTTCDDYDLCSQCEGTGLHPEHCMVRVPTPDMPRAIIRAAVKRSRHFLKTVVTAVEEERCKKRREPSSEGKRRSDHGHSHSHNHFHGHGHRQHSSDHENHRRQRGSWLETFATYMNEFANLAGDINIEIDKSEPKQTQAQSAQSQKEPTSSTTREQQHCSFPSGNLDAYKVHEILRMYSMEPTKSTSKNSDNSNPSMTSVPKNNDVEMGQGDRKSTESDKESLKSDKESVKSDKESLKSDKESLNSEVSSVAESESVKDDNPDKIDDWTVINKERDLMDSDEKPNDPTPPIGFNLPEEFKERVNISGRSLYPPLNEATAVLKPKEPDVKAASAATAESSTDMPEPSAPPTEKSKAEPRKRHPLRHIDAAIDQMLAMGFTNDGGWLTQLLESKNGNIVAVLDLLTPVNPQKLT